MADAQITCITKNNPQSRHEYITHVGNCDGSWRWTVEQVVESIERGTNTFFVLDPITGKRGDVRVVHEQGKRPYIRTQADGILTDNLLSLIQCP